MIDDDAGSATPAEKEYLAGFWIIEAPDLDVALKLAAEGSKHCNRARPFQ
jgi:hypothetical protein